MKISTIKTLIANLSAANKKIVLAAAAAEAPDAPKTTAVKKAPTFKTISKAAFNRLPKLRKRVLIAEDVLAQLKANKIAARRGILIETSALKGDYSYNNTHSIDGHESVQCEIQNAAKCHVCAKGSVIYALANKFNTVTGNDLDAMYTGEYDAEDALDTRAIFGIDLWSELEAQFEGSAEYRSEDVHELMGTSEDDHIIKQELPALMKNLIKNKGKLKIGKYLIG